MNGAHFVVKALQQQGVEQVFGYPGGAIMPVYDALYDCGVDHLLCRHEQGAAMAAIGYARSTGGVGVCIATSGPGATNLITGLADALLDSVPIVAITGQVATPLIGTDAFQEVDVLGMSLSCTKHSFMVQNAEELGSVITQAFEVARSGRPGPVLVDIPKDIQLAEIEHECIKHMVAKPEAPQADEIAAAKALLAAAEKPLLYVGGGVTLADAESQLRDFLAVTEMPSMTTLKGIGTIAPEQTGFLGMVGMHGTKAANFAVQEADLLVVAGARFDDRVTGKLDEFAVNAKVIHLDIDAAELGKLRQPDVAISADLKQVLPQLAQTLSIAPWQAHCTQMKQDFGWRYDHPGEAIYAPLLLKQLSDLAPKHTVVTCDVGQHQMWVAQHIEFDSPKDHLSSSGLGTMGFGVPAAVGAQVARPEDIVVAVSGDGSFMMNVQELGTIKRRKLPVKILLIDNQRLGMVRQWQKLFFEGRYSETILTDNPDFVNLAKSFDIPGETIVVKEQVEPALQRMLNSEGAYLLHVAISEEENVWPLVPPGAANDKMMEDCES
ncbi:acetolactate synthase 2 catalytic subunit [Motilimonas pumila]|uniref:Acetolactate synthase n=1 Tax=Motilimonas pumila TaxID=2303987 RepID=A0A418YHS9_9GAMM|nr:acetolactate synthase 2 catalytic subunit [Motilimonas pumila]RJG49519.1 acetolactate synthase 2 catalytic subunit [Motilimonas pumila]